MEEKKSKNSKTTKKNKNSNKPAAKKSTNKSNSKPANKKNVKTDPKETTKELEPVVKKIKVTQKDRQHSDSKPADKQIRDTFKGSNDEMSKLLKIVLIVTAIMLVFYGITVLVTKKADEVISDQNDESQAAETVIQYDNIMIGTMLNYRGTYYVLIKVKDDNRVAEYETLIKTIESSDEAPTFYSANLTDAFNKNYLAKEAKYDVDNIADFRVTGTTLVKVVDGKINAVYDNYDNIKAQLNELA